MISNKGSEKKERVLITFFFFNSMNEKFVTRTYPLLPEHLLLITNENQVCELLNVNQFCCNKLNNIGGWKIRSIPWLS